MFGFLQILLENKYLAFVFRFPNVSILLLRPNNTRLSPVSVPDPVAFFSLNISYGTKEISNRVTQKDHNNVHLAQGPDGKANGSFEFKGKSDSYIVFRNSSDWPLNDLHSMTMLCWLYYNGHDGPIFKYRTSKNRRVTLGVFKGKLFARFIKRVPLEKATSMNTSLAGGWKFVGASYNHTSGEVKLWVDGVMVHKEEIAAGLILSAQGNVRMGAWRDSNHRFFKGRIAEMQVYDLALTQEQIRVIQEKTHRPGEKYALLTKFIFSFLWIETKSRSIKS